MVYAPKHQKRNSSNVQRSTILKALEEARQSKSLQQEKTDNNTCVISLSATFQSFFANLEYSSNLRRAYQKACAPKRTRSPPTPIRIPVSAHSRVSSQYTLVGNSPCQLLSPLSPSWAAAKDLVDRHRAYSENSWQVYNNYYKNKEAEWIVEIVGWLFLKENEKRELRSELWTAENTIKAREVDIANNNDDYEAELGGLKEERDEAKRDLEKRVRQLKRAEEKKQKVQVEAKEANEECKKLRRELAASQQQTIEAKSIAEDLKARLDHVNGELRTFLSTNASTRMILEQRTQIHQLQASNIVLERQKNEVYEALEAATAKNDSQEVEIDELTQGVIAAQNHAKFYQDKALSYQSCFEEQPERTAHLDNLLKRKDEVYDNLLVRYKQCAEQKMEQEKARAIDRETFVGVRAGLLRSLATKKEKIKGLKKNRNDFQALSEEIREMFTKKIFPNDVVKAINSEHEILRQDNAFLALMVRARETHVQEQIAKISPLQVQIIELESAMEKSQAKQTELQAEVNGLTTWKGDLEVARDLQEIALNLRQEDLDKAEAERERLEAILRGSPPSSP